MANLENILNGPWSPPEPSAPRSPEEQFRQAILDSGITPPDVIVIDGQLHRFATSESKKDTAGWYIGFSDGIPAGAFGCWRSGVQSTWTADIGRELSPAESMARASHIRQAQEKSRQLREKNAEIASDTVSTIWLNCQSASEDHPYLRSKGVKPHGIKISGDGRLVLPLYNSDGTLSSLQYIDTAGNKLYHSGAATHGKYHIIGDINNNGVIYIAEGFATCATIYEETGNPVVVAYSAHNLVPVTATIKEQHPNASVVIVADNDKSNAGENYATQAAAKYGARVLLCPVEGDVNDYRQHGGDVKTLLSDTNGSILEKMKVVFGDELSDTYEAPDEIVQDLLVSRSLAVLYGASNSGKTFWALSLAAAISEDKDFFGKRVDGGLVVYLASEAPGTIRQRMQAIKKHQKTELKNLAMVPIPLNFYKSMNHANDVIELCQTIEREKGRPIRLIIGDTLARMSSGANENSGEDMGPIMDRFDAVAHATGAALLVIHHSGKNKAAGARGWSGIQAHISTEIEVTEENGIRMAEVTKQRELPSKGTAIYFDLDVVPMGIGKFGNEVTTCIAVPDERPHEPKRSATLKKYMKVVTNAWASKSGEFVHDMPYLSRSALRDYMVENDTYAKGSIKNYMSAEATSGPVVGLLESGDIREHEHGFLIVAPDIIATIGLVSGK